jgi:hypothetical protein
MPEPIPIARLFLSAIHAAQLKAHITRQREIGERTLEAGCPSELAETTLRLFEKKPSRIREASPTDPRPVEAPSRQSKGPSWCRTAATTNDDTGEANRANAEAMGIVNRARHRASVRSQRFNIFNPLDIKPVHGCLGHLENV